MDLLGDLGTSDQLTSCRLENRVLQKKVDELQLKVRELTIENESLKAEVNEYRKEALSLASNFQGLSVTKGINAGAGDDNVRAMDEHLFVKSGNGIFASEVCASLDRLHGSANPLCGCLNGNDSLLATGGADGMLVITQWGMATAPSPDASKNAVEKAVKIRCDAPVLRCAFSPSIGTSSTISVVAAGCMDGSVKLYRYSSDRLIHLSAYTNVGSDVQMSVDGEQDNSNALKHMKYIKDLAWCTDDSNTTLLASACAEGKVFLSKISLPHVFSDVPENVVHVERIQTFYLPGAVEALCFLDNGSTLCCYARGTSYLSYFDLKHDFKLTKHSVNGANKFDDFVSFSILSLKPSPNGKFLAAATDTSRQIIFESGTSNIVRDLYGHKNDGFSNPKIAWSKSGMYLFGNSQEDTDIYVWEIAGSSIVKKLDKAHTGQVRDLYASAVDDTLVSISYDKTVKIWTVPFH
mmetsp:Transcript_12310/g.16069  ORF Transcript_12310/g.16069 Transcript_12310/m.16069 type:complete len:464 (-) Transcript_12310:367-1758(-)